MAHQGSSDRDELACTAYDDIDRVVKKSQLGKSEKTVLESTLDFLERRPSAHDRDTLLRFLSARSDRQRLTMASILPLEEVTQRLQLIRKIKESCVGQQELGALDFASLLYAPLDHLQYLASSSIVAFGVQQTIPEMRKLVKICMSRPINTTLSSLLTNLHSSHQKGVPGVADQALAG